MSEDNLHIDTLNLGESASAGTGIWISTLLAVERLLNWLLAYKEQNSIYCQINYNSSLHIAQLCW